MENVFRSLPSVDKVLSDERLKRLEEKYPRQLIVDLARRQMELARQSITASKTSPTFEELVEYIIAQVRLLETPSLRPVINASGVILHTNLGRAPLSRETIAAMETISRGYCNLEFDLETGARGSRNTHIEMLLRQLTGAEAALVVNSNAAAVLLALTTLAKRKEVIVSRGEAVEIGGGFRIPDVMRQSGAKLVEVGTTNCTYASDYESAITERTAALMRVHSSNFRVVGYTHSITIEELVTVAGKLGLPVLDDQGSGCFLDTTRFGLAPEPMVQQSIAAGCGLVLFSGDKLLGGPQAGIVVGKKELVDRLKRHPLVRAVRIDKVRLAGLAATLLHYLKGEALDKIPVWRMIAAPLAEIERRAQAWASVTGGRAKVVDGETEVGGGSLPGSTLKTKLVAIKGKGASSAQALYRQLSQQETPIIGRISGDTLLLDPRAVLPEEYQIVVEALRILR
ncbi:MAG: L-seryl-tRNA(Sec) selenium transferase [Chloroflexi bacterium]|nr:L-seryl-tRNA(Sec) selenium transferase [Chloroflexota bacterium]